jgi:hypothetical protein
MSIDDITANAVAPPSPDGAAASSSQTTMPGWYTDPGDPTRQRYWDGDGWSGDSLPVDDPHPEGAYFRPPADEAIRGEVEREASDGDGKYPPSAIPVPICGQIVHVLEPRDWYSSAVPALNTGDFDGWADAALAGDDYDTIWCQLNDGRGPLNREVEAFFEVYGRLTGAEPGKSRTLQRSLARTRRR